jgi:8-oxo-dGTP diphosphatase
MHDCAMAVLRNGNRVLMCHRHPRRNWFPDVWDFPGGHIEGDETAAQTLVRELDEELGVSIDLPAGPADEVLVSVEDAVRLAVWVIDYGGPLENRCPEEHDEIRWVSLDDAGRLDLAHPGYITLIAGALDP